MKHPLQHFSLSATILASSIMLSLAGCATQTANLTTIAPKLTTVPISIEFVRNVEGINEYLLSNGMKVLLYPDQSQSKVIVNLTYRVGSVDENYGETGMAHLLEHMLFKGSTHYQYIDKEFGKRGMRANATTWFDRTNYYESFESSQENLEWALGMEADRMMNATFTQDELESEMTVVRNEMERGENSPEAMLSARMDSTSYLWHNYANSTIGARSDVENFPFDKLRRFYEKHYRPDNAVLTVAGRFDQQQILDIVKKEFGKLAKPDTPIDKLYTVEPVQDGERVVNLRRSGEVPIVAVQYHVPEALHPDTPAINVLETILSDSARGRLQKQLVESGLSSSAEATSFSRKDPSILTFMAHGFKGKDSADLEAKLIQVAENIKATPITEDEVKLAKAAILKSKEDELKNVIYAGSALTEYIAAGDYRYIFFIRDLIEQVKVEDVQRVAEKYLVRSNRTLGRFIPTQEPVRAVIERDDSVLKQLENYKGREVAVAGEVYDNTVDNIEARKQEFVWDIGTTVSVYPKKLRGNEVKLSMILNTGNAKSLTGYQAEFSLLGDLLYAGSEAYSKEEIASKLDELKANVNISTNTIGEIYIDLSSAKENLNDTLDFVAELITRPKFEASEIEIARKAKITELESARTEPYYVASNKFYQTFNPYPAGHPKAFRSIDQQIEDLNKVNHERLQSLYGNHMNFTHAHIGVVGDVTPADISESLRQKFSQLTSTIEYEEMQAPLKPVKNAVNWLETPDKANAELIIGHVIDLNVKEPDYYATVIANSIFGGGGFASRLMQRIRVKEGYSYGTGSQIKLGYTDKNGMFLMYAIAAPENMKKVLAAYKEEVQKAQTAGFTAEEVNNAIAGELKRLSASWANDARIAALMVENKDLDRDLMWFTEYQTKLQQLSVEEVNAAFNKYIARDDLNIFAAGDFAKVADNM